MTWERRIEWRRMTIRIELKEKNLMKNVKLGDVKTSTKDVMIVWEIEPSPL